MPRTNFVPSQHGFLFKNTFVNHIGPAITTQGLCGGMVLAALRYYLHNIPIPTHTASDFGPGRTDPAEGTRLREYIYACQVDSYGPLGLASALNWVTSASFDTQYDWSVTEFGRICAQLRTTNVPIVLGLRVHEYGNPFGHQVLAIGFDEAERSVLIYDPNYPNEECRLQLDPASRTIKHLQSGVHSLDYDRYSSFFITGCRVEAPPPAYIDLGLQSGVTVRPRSLPAVTGESLDAEPTVRNFGDFPAPIERASCRLAPTQTQSRRRRRFPAAPARWPKRARQKCSPSVGAF